MRRPVPRDDEGAALLIAIATILIVATLSLIVTAAVVTQVTPAQFAQKNTRTSHAAEAGLDVALGVIRNAQATSAADTSTTSGYRELLPCDAGGSTWTRSGPVDGEPGDIRYQVTVRYYTSDPTGRDQAWLNANAVTCTGTGPAALPQFAHLVSVGTGSDAGQNRAGAATRTISQVYELRTTNANIPGGLVHRDRSTNTLLTDLCLDAGSALPTNGATVRWEVCDPSDEGQIMWWRKDFSIVLTSTVNRPSGEKCVTAAVSSIPGSLTMQPCTASYPQRWGYTDSGLMQAFPNYPGSSTAYCMYLPTLNAAALAQVTTVACTAGIYDTQAGIRPDATVGAGSVGDIGDTVATDQPYQWVNFAEFGRCFDITGWDVNATNMISYPCKQSPISTVGWNQTLSWNPTTMQLRVRTGSTGQAYTATTGSYKCLQAPGGSANPPYTVMRDCQTGTIGDAQKWTVNRNTGYYPTSYTVVNADGRCLSVRPQSGSGNSQWSAIVTETCDGSDRQKWNSPPGQAPAIVRDTREG